MIDVGIHIDQFPLKLQEFAATLLFQEYPTTTVHMDAEGYPVIKEWVDISDDYVTNQFFYYRTDRFHLKQFIEGILSHNELINQAIDGIVYYEYDSEGKKTEYRISPVGRIPKEHKPKIDFYFKLEDGVEVEAIRDFFLLDNIELKTVA